MTTQKPPLLDFTLRNAFHGNKIVNGSIKLTCATDPIRLQNKIRSQINSTQYLNPSNLLSPKFTIPVCGQKTNTETAQKEKKNNQKHYNRTNRRCFTP